jgi:hypothetical protein
VSTARRVEQWQRGEYEVAGCTEPARLIAINRPPIRPAAGSTCVQVTGFSLFQTPIKNLYPNG